MKTPPSTPRHTSAAGGCDTLCPDDARDHRGGGGGGSLCRGGGGAGAAVRGIAGCQGSNLGHCAPGDPGDHTHHGSRGHGQGPGIRDPPPAPAVGHPAPSSHHSPRHHALACNNISQ